MNSTADLGQSACPSIRPSVRAAKIKEEELSVHGVFVCVSNCHADMVDRLLIYEYIL